jgi:hypothetical protein
LTDIVRVKDEYYVRASSALADDRTRVLKYGDTFAVFDRYGDIEAFGPSQFGLFQAECRHLSRFTMRVNQLQPLLLSSTIREDNSFLSVDLPILTARLIPKTPCREEPSTFSVYNFSERQAVINIFACSITAYNLFAFHFSFNSMRTSPISLKCAAQSARERANACLIRSRETPRFWRTRAWMVWSAAPAWSFRRGLRPLRRARLTSR